MTRCRDGPYKETILLVDDEDTVQQVVSEILERQGYRVLTAPDGIRALTLSSRFPAPIHLLVTDVVMPRMSGWEIARCLSAQRPTMKVLFMSGYSEVALFEEARSEARRPFLRKPFLHDSLLAKIREVLDAT
ncbi:response regulator [Candidatus Nitrospira bockiana]